MLKKLRLLSIFFFVLSFPVIGKAEAISLSAQVDKTEIPFEETVELRLEIKWQGGIGNYLFELLPLPETQNLKVLGSATAVSSTTEGGQEVTTRSFRYTLSPTKAGLGVIEPIVLKYVSMPDSIPGELVSQRFQILIAKPVPREVKSGIGSYIWFSVPAVIIIAGIVFWFIRRKKNKIPKEVPKSPEESALEELTIIKKDLQFDRKAFFTRLYKLIIMYLENKYRLESAGKSAENIMAELEGLDMPAGDKDKVKGWLTIAEKEKYAPMGGSPGDILRLSAELESFWGK
jgi:hypothetical protein